MVSACAGAIHADGHGREMTVRTLALYVVPLALLGIGVVTLLVTKWQRKHAVFRDRKHPAEYLANARSLGFHRLLGALAPFRHADKPRRWRQKPSSPMWPEPR